MWPAHLLDVFLNDMRRINPRFTYLLTGTFWAFNIGVGLWAQSTLGARHFARKWTRSTLDCDQSNYSSRIVFSHIPIECGHTGNGAIRSADPENPTIEPNMKWSGRPLAEIWPFEFSQMWGRWSVVGRWSLVGPQYNTSSYTVLIYSSSLRYERSAQGVKI